MIINDSVSSSAYIQRQMMELRSCRRKWWYFVVPPYLLFRGSQRNAPVKRAASRPRCGPTFFWIWTRPSEVVADRLRNKLHRF